MVYRKAKRGGEDRALAIRLFKRGVIWAHEAGDYIGVSPRQVFRDAGISIHEWREARRRYVGRIIARFEAQASKRKQNASKA